MRLLKTLISFFLQARKYISKHMRDVGCVLLSLTTCFIAISGGAPFRVQTYRQHEVLDPESTPKMSLAFEKVSILISNQDIHFILQHYNFLSFCISTLHFPESTRTPVNCPSQSPGDCYSSTDRESESHTLQAICPTERLG